MADPQPAVAISPVAATVYVGSTVDFSATGGAGTGLFVWTGAAEGYGSEKQVQFDLVGVYQVSVYRNADADYDQSNTATASITVLRLPVGTPEFSPEGGSYDAPQLVSITSSTEGALIRYTTDGVDPTPTIGTLYTGPVAVSGDVTLKAIGYLPGYPDSPVSSATYSTLPSPPVVNIDATVSVGPAPLATRISWSAVNASSAVISGPGLSSSQLAGFKDFENLDVGSYEFSILAFNTGGMSQSSITVSSLTSTIDFVIEGTKTVYFYDRTTYSSDAWLWEFGDGGTSTEQNPVHSYGFDGIFVVKLTAWCDGKPSVAIRTVAISGCFTSDPLPFTANWEDLVNEETYPPWDDPRFPIDPESEYNDVLGFVASKEGFDNKNWDVCPYVDWAYGPSTIGTTEYRFKTRWTLYLDPSSKRWRWGKGSATAEPPISLLPEIVSEPAYFNDVNFVTLSFSVTAQPYIAFQKGPSHISVRWIKDDGTTASLSFPGRTPKLFGESNIQPAAHLCDVVLYYLKDDGMIYVRFQRDGFLVERAMQKPTLYGSELAVLTKVDDIRTDNIRRIYLYGYTLGHRKILLRSAQYPVYPSDTPTDVDLTPEIAEMGVQLGGGHFSIIVHAAGASTDLEGGSATKSVDAIEAPIHLEGGSTLPAIEKAETDFTLEGGWASRLNHETESLVVLGAGTHAPVITQSAESSLSLDSGTHVPKIKKAISELTLDSGDHVAIKDQSSVTYVSFDAGTHSDDRDDEAESALTLDSGTHWRQEEWSTSAVSVDRGTNFRRVDAAQERMTFDRGVHKIKEQKADQETQLTASRHLLGRDVFVDLDLQLRSGSHILGFNGSSTVSTHFEKAAHTLEEWRAATMSSSVEGAAHLRASPSSVQSDHNLESGAHSKVSEAFGVVFSIENGSHSKLANSSTSIESIDSGTNCVLTQLATNQPQFDGGVHYFQLFTFDYDGSLPYVDPSQDDRWDSTQRTWDLDISIQPDIA